ncbi:MAG TPA: glycine cleavage T C-terminal barrel domain-containing protein [Microthrixaceae bacterium]|nr:glycine cleavage T C-terminal barrel domain-containing protein [Microthrixaceae bacterium]
MTTVEHVTTVEQSLEADYDVLRSSAALINLSDVGLVRVEGSGAHDLVQHLLSRDIEFLTPERSITGLLLTEDGTAVDMVSCIVDDDGLVLRTGFGTGRRVADHLEAHATPETVVELLDLEILGVEGPYAWSAIGEVLDPDIASLPFESVLPLGWGDHEITFSRIGVTGEYGYQLCGTTAAIGELREALTGPAVPIGRAAVEVAMLEVRQPLLSRELADGADVLTAGLQWLLDLSKPEFLGREAVVEGHRAGQSHRTIGIEVDAPADGLEGCDLVVDDHRVGTVVWAVRSPQREGALALARIRAELAASGLELAVATNDGSSTARTLSSPYVVPASWGVPIL